MCRFALRCAYAHGALGCIVMPHPELRPRLRALFEAAAKRALAVDPHVDETGEPALRQTSPPPCPRSRPRHRGCEASGRKVLDRCLHSQGETHATKTPEPRAAPGGIARKSDRRVSVRARVLSQSTAKRGSNDTPQAGVGPRSRSSVWPAPPPSCRGRWREVRASASAPLSPGHRNERIGSLHRPRA